MDEKESGGVFYSSEESPKPSNGETLALGNRISVDGLLKLHLGCGDKYWQGYVNCDYAENWSGRKPDVACNLYDLPFEDESASEAHAIHVVEHFPRVGIGTVLTEWHRVLVKGGTLAVECPCLEKIVRTLASSENVGKKRLMSIFGLFGNVWEGKGMQHYWCYMVEEMRGLMLESGFSTAVAKQPIFHQQWRDMRIVATK